MKQDLVFDHIPTLAELLPTTRGLPGVEYYQVCVNNLRKAQDDGLSDVLNTYVYTIEGPGGRADLKLMCRGKPIAGVAPESGARKCWIDRDVWELTSLTRGEKKEDAETYSKGRTPRKRKAGKGTGDSVEPETPPVAAQGTQ